MLSVTIVGIISFTVLIQTLVVIHFLRPAPLSFRIGLWAEFPEYNTIVLRIYWAVPSDSHSSGSQSCFACSIDSDYVTYAQISVPHDRIDNVAPSMSGNALIGE